MLLPGFFLARLFFHAQEGFVSGFSLMGGETLLVPLMIFNAVFYTGAVYLIFWGLIRQRWNKNNPSQE